MSLSSNANVYNSCLLILRERGFKMHIEGEIDEEGCYPFHTIWRAEKGAFLFTADNPVELLGLVAIHDHVQPSEDKPYWWFQQGDDVWDQLRRAAFPEVRRDDA